MKKAVSLLLIVCLAITLLTGCSGNANPAGKLNSPRHRKQVASQTDAAQNECGRKRACCEEDHGHRRYDVQLGKLGRDR